jgi:uncharacterized membrane protein YjdF
MVLQAQSELRWLGGGVALLLLLSGLDPVADRYTWFLETFPVMIGLALLGAICAQLLLANRHDRQLRELGVS